MEYFISDRMAVRPMGLPFMVEAWDGCMHWAFGSVEVRITYQKETGRSLPVCRDLDLAHEFSADEIEMACQFCDWATVNIWGEE